MSCGVTSSKDLYLLLNTTQHFVIESDAVLSVTPTPTRIPGKYNVKGKVMIDTNRDCQGEVAAPDSLGATVNLSYTNGAFITSAPVYSGNYSFLGITGGKWYRVQLDMPPGYQMSCGVIYYIDFWLAGDYYKEFVIQSVSGNL